MVRSSPRGGSCLVGALSTEEARGPRERARGSPTGHGGQWTTLTDAAETLGQSSPQLLHLADLLRRLRFNEVAHLGGAGPGQLRETGPAQRSAAQRRQRRARARGAGKAAPRPAPPPPRGPRATRSARKAAGLGPGPRLGARGRLTWCRGRPRSPPPGGPRAAPPPAAFSLLCKREPRGRGQRLRQSGRGGAGGCWRGARDKFPNRRGGAARSPATALAGGLEPGTLTRPRAALRLRLRGLRRPPGPAAPGRRPLPAARAPLAAVALLPRVPGLQPAGRGTDGRTDGRRAGLRADPVHPVRCGAVCSVLASTLKGWGVSRAMPRV